MIAERDLATTRAALAYWRDEMSPHGLDAQAPYFDDEGANPLTGDEIDRLREGLRTASLRRARFVGPHALRLLPREEGISALAAGEGLPAVLIPPQGPTDR
jgi:hypothetical protein